MKRVYIIHPYQGREENKKRISEICKAVANMGYLPISPVHAFSFLDDSIPEEREQALELCKELISVCDQAWLFGDWVNSKGCLIEQEVARRCEIPIVDLGFLLSRFGELKELVECGF